PLETMNGELVVSECLQTQFLLSVLFLFRVASWPAANMSAIGSLALILFFSALVYCAYAYCRHKQRQNSFQLPISQPQPAPLPLPQPQPQAVPQPQPAPPPYTSRAPGTNAVGI